MSEPAGITAKVKMSQDGFKKFLRKEANNIAKLIYEDYADESKNWYVWKYLPKEQAMYCFIYFNYGNGEWIEKCEHTKILLRLENFLEDDSKGYLLGMIDSLNLSGFVYEYAIENKKWISKKYAKKEIEPIWEDAKKYFFKYAEQGEFGKALFGKKQILDKSIFSNILKHQEQHRVKMLKETLHTATTIKPLQIFKHYFYNGTDFYYCNGHSKISIFQNINLQALRQTPYGVCDDKQIIVLDKSLAENTEKFTMLHRAYTTYYKSDTKVYDENLQPIPNADAKSFKLIEDYVAVDNNFVYINNKAIPRLTLGDFKFDNAIFYCEKLLIGTKQIWLDGELITDIDAPTFESIDFKDDEIYKDFWEIRSGYVSATIKQGRDKHGDLFILRLNTYKDINPIMNIPFHKPMVLRKSRAEFVAWYKPLVEQVILECKKFGENNFFDYFPTDAPTIFQNFYDKVNLWNETYFEAHYPKIKYSSEFLLGVNNYLYSCWQLYEQSGSKKNFMSAKKYDKSYLEKGLAFYQKLAADHVAVVNPHIFHHLVSFHVVLGNLEKAIEYFRLAFLTGYPMFDKMLLDEDLKPIYKNETFKKCKAWFDEHVKTAIKDTRPGVVNWRWSPNPNPYPFVNHTLLDYLDQLPDELKLCHKMTFGSNHLLTRIVETFAIYDLQDPAEINTDLQKEMQEVNLRFAPYFNQYMQNKGVQNWYSGNIYEYYQDFKMMNAQSHLARMEYIFFDSHDEYGHSTLADIAPVFERLKKAIVIHKESQEFIEKINQSLVMQVLKLKIE